MTNNIFTKGVERLINPIDVAFIHVIQGLNKYLPKKVQRYFVESSSKQIPYMGFVVEPYAFFLCYEINDIKAAEALLPENFRMIKTRIFTNDEPKYYCIFGCFTAHTSAFWGSRVEFYIIAEDQKTGLLSWIIIDYDSNTISYDKKNGLKSPNSSKAVITTDHSGTLYVDVQRDDRTRALICNAKLENAVMTKLDQRLWLEGNLSVGYGKVLSENDADIFSLRFDPREVEKGLKINFNNVDLKINSWFPGLFKDIPSEIVCFPYAQHFISDSPGSNSKIQNREDMEKANNQINFENIEVFSASKLIILFAFGIGLSMIITLVLSILLILK